MKNLLKKLTEINGPAGGEGKIRKIIRQEINDLADEIKEDKMGNLIAFKEGKSSDHSIMLAAHMDEIGLIATHLDEDGFIRFSSIGGMSPYTLLGKRVIFNNDIPGVVDKEDKLDKISKLKHSKMYIDIGAKSRNEAQEKVSIGDTACYDSKFRDLGDRVIGKALDDRAGCAVLIETLREMETPVYDTCFVFTVQEEVGLRGAKVSAYGIEPDVGIVVDLTLTGDRPEAKRMSVSLGKGPAIKIKDRSVLVNRELKDLMIETAKEEDITYQLEVLTRGGTDTGSIQLTKEGVIAGAVSIPGRYIHSPSEMIDINDLKQAKKLIFKLVNKKMKKLI